MIVHVSVLLNRTVAGGDGASSSESKGFDKPRWKYCEVEPTVFGAFPRSLERLIAVVMVSDKRGHCFP